MVYRAFVRLSWMCVVLSSSRVLYEWVVVSAGCDVSVVAYAGCVVCVVALVACDGCVCRCLCCV